MRDNKRRESGKDDGCNRAGVGGPKRELGLREIAGPPNQLRGSQRELGGFQRPLEGPQR